MRIKNILLFALGALLALCIFAGAQACTTPVTIDTGGAWIYDSQDGRVDFTGEITGPGDDPQVGAVGTGYFIATTAQLASLNNDDTVVADEAQITWSDGPALAPTDPPTPGGP